MIVGEAVKGLDPRITARRPEIAWKGIAGLRDLLTHECFRIELDEIEQSVRRDLAPLDRAVEALLRQG